MAVALSVALPAWRTMTQREKEAELVFRGEQYARAIALFQRFADADDRDEPGAKCGRSLSVHGQVRLAKQRPALGVPDDRELGSGLAPVVEMRAKGISVSIGADGAACNNRLDMFEEMRLAAVLQSVRHRPGAENGWSLRSGRCSRVSWAQSPKPRRSPVRSTTSSKLIPRCIILVIVVVMS